MITERTLKQWRRDALKCKANPLLKFTPGSPESVDIAILKEQEYCERILRLTQDLLDIQLMKKG